METDYTIKFFPVDQNGHVLGEIDDSKWLTAKLYQRIIGFIFPKYRKKFLIIKPIQINNVVSDNGVIVADITLLKFKDLSIEISQNGFELKDGNERNCSVKTKK